MNPAEEPFAMLSGKKNATSCELSSQQLPELPNRQIPRHAVLSAVHGDPRPALPPQRNLHSDSSTCLSLKTSRKNQLSLIHSKPLARPGHLVVLLDHLPEEGALPAGVHVVHPQLGAGLDQGLAVLHERPDARAHAFGLLHDVLRNPREKSLEGTPKCGFTMSYAKIQGKRVASLSWGRGVCFSWLFSQGWFSGLATSQHHQPHLARGVVIGNAPKPILNETKTHEPTSLKQPYRQRLTGTPNTNQLEPTPDSPKVNPKPSQQQPGCQPFALPKSTRNHPKTNPHEDLSQPNPPNLNQSP